MAENHAYSVLDAREEKDEELVKMRYTSDDFILFRCRYIYRPSNILRDQRSGWGNGTTGPQMDCGMNTAFGSQIRRRGGYVLCVGSVAETGRG